MSSRRRAVVASAATGGTLAAVAGLAVALRRFEPSTQLRRTVRLWLLSARRAGHYAALRVRGATADEERRAELDARFAIRTAEDVAAELGDMKGAVMKLGQMVSFIAPGLPPEAREILATLQSNVPPMAPSLAESVIEAELGAPPAKLFAHWDPEPVAAASIGQVHKVVLRDGRDAAVKVQYPGVGEAISADLANAENIAAMLGLLASSNLDVEAMVGELRARMSDELDYRLEARFQTDFATRYAGHPFIVIPEVVPALSASRVLTSEWVEGISWQQMLDGSDRSERDRIGEIIFRFGQGAIFRHGVFNGDPHPGNYRFRPDGRVAFLDFGLVKRWDGPDLDGLGPVLDGVLARDPVATVAAMVAAGFLAPDHGLEPEAVWQYVSRPYAPYLVDRWTFRHEWVGETLASMIDVYGPDGPVVRALNMPPSFVILDRVVWGSSAILGELGATNNFRSIVLEYRSGAAPATVLGRQEAAWAARRG